jgi:hypothetical protein
MGLQQLSGGDTCTWTVTCTNHSESFMEEIWLQLRRAVMRDKRHPLIRA